MGQSISAPVLEVGLLNYQVPIIIPLVKNSTTNISVKESVGVFLDAKEAEEGEKTERGSCT